MSFSTILVILPYYAIPYLQLHTVLASAEYSAQTRSVQQRLSHIIMHKDLHSASVHKHVWFLCSDLHKLLVLSDSSGTTLVWNDMPKHAVAVSGRLAVEGLRSGGFLSSPGSELFMEALLISTNSRPTHNSDLNTLSSHPLSGISSSMRSPLSSAWGLCFRTTSAKTDNTESLQRSEKQDRGASPPLCVAYFYFLYRISLQHVNQFKITVSRGLTFALASAAILKRKCRARSSQHRALRRYCKAEQKIIHNIMFSSEKLTLKKCT